MRSACNQVGGHGSQSNLQQPFYIRLRPEALTARQILQRCAADRILYQTGSARLRARFDGGGLPWVRHDQAPYPCDTSKLDIAALYAIPRPAAVSCQVGAEADFTGTRAPLAGCAASGPVARQHAARRCWRQSAELSAGLPVAGATRRRRHPSRGLRLYGNQRRSHTWCRSGRHLRGDVSHTALRSCDAGRSSSVNISIHPELARGLRSRWGVIPPA